MKWLYVVHLDLIKETQLTIQADNYGKCETLWACQEQVCILIPYGGC